MSEIYKVEIKGTRPLLMNSCRHMLEEKKNKLSRGREEVEPREEAKKFLYIDKKENYYWERYKR